MAGTWTSQVICTRAAAIAKFKGGLSVAGQYLNAVLQELCQEQDFLFCRGTQSGTLNPSSPTTATFPNNVSGSGPYNLPADYLRINKKEMFWFLNGVPYPMIACDMSEYDAQIQQQGFQSYPGIYATDLSTNPGTFVVWPPSGGSYPWMLRYQRLMADIGSGATAQGAWNPGSTAPESASVVPWFPSAPYLYTRVAGELMKDTSDSRWQAFLGDAEPEKDQPGSANAILRSFMKKTNDNDNRAKRVDLDPRRFRIPQGNLSDTKKIWG